MNLSPTARTQAASVLETRGPEHVFSEGEFLLLIDAVFTTHSEQDSFAVVKEIRERRSITHGGRSIPVPFRLDENAVTVIDAMDLALLLCRLDGWDHDPSPTLWPQLQMTAHVRFIGMLVALRVGAPQAPSR